MRGKSSQPELPPGHAEEPKHFGGGGRGFRGGRGGGGGFANNDSFQNGRGGGRGGGFGGRGGTRNFGGGGRGAPNDAGFHGSLTEDPRLEAELFGDEGHVTQGINFDKVGVSLFMFRIEIKLGEIELYEFWFCAV